MACTIPVPTAKPPRIPFQWVFKGSKALRTSSGSGRENRLRVCICEEREREANFVGFLGAYDFNSEVDRREEDPFFVARRVAAAAENIFSDSCFVDASNYCETVRDSVEMENRSMCFRLSLQRAQLLVSVRKEILPFDACFLG
mmetsp:Transcript_24950/g.53140  ORF Transcript_24950/g.53140 Transcript_24950/m.53140 type:complete len:143 (-) Transcript_24950:33-461(-)